MVVTCGAGREVESGIPRSASLRRRPRPAHLEVEGEGAAHVLLLFHGRLAHHGPAEVGLDVGGGSGNGMGDGNGVRGTGDIPFLPHSWDTAGSQSG